MSTVRLIHQNPKSKLTVFLPDFQFHEHFELINKMERVGSNSSSVLPTTGPHKKSGRWLDISGFYSQVPYISATLISVTAVAIIPWIGLWVTKYLWGHLKQPVNRDNCTCSCFDTIVKGPYENGVSRYKHVYINATSNTSKMWIVIVLTLIAGYVSIKRLLLLLFLGNLRVTMGVLFLSSIHSHCYSAWMFWNYLNDDFYAQWNRQLLFTITEITCTTLVLLHMDKRKGNISLRSSPALLLIFSIALFHVFRAGLDQFLLNVILGKGELHQVIRDIPFMLTDILHISVVLFELWQLKERNSLHIYNFMWDRKNLSVFVASQLIMYGAAITFLHE